MFWYKNVFCAVRLNFIFMHLFSKFTFTYLPRRIAVLFTLFVAVFIFSFAFSGAQAINGVPNITNVEGCNADHTACTAGEVKPGQVVFVTVTGLSAAELSGAKIVFDTTYFDTGVAGGNILSAGVPTDLGYNGHYGLKVIGSFTDVVYTPGITVTAATPTPTPTPVGGTPTPTPVGGTPTPTPPSDPAAGGAVQTGLNQIKNKFQGQSEIAKSQTIGDIILAIIRILIFLLLGVAVLALIIGGFLYVTSAGNEDQVKRGRRTITYAIIGLVIVLLAYVIVNIISTTVGEPTTTTKGWSSTVRV